MNLMKKIIVIILTILLYALTVSADFIVPLPLIPTNQYFIYNTNMYAVTEGIRERFYATYNMNVWPDEPYPRWWGLITNRSATNFIWNVYGHPGNAYPGSWRCEYDEALYMCLRNYYVVTNSWEEGYFDNKGLSSINLWNQTNLYYYLKAHFTNTDGITGVGTIVSNVPNVGNNWLWTLTFNTSQWRMCLGSLTYAITNMAMTNLLNPSITNMHYYLGWIYTDGDRIVKKVNTLDNSVPPEWANFSGNNWWDYEGQITLMHGLIFDWCDYETLSNKLTVTTGSTNWFTLQDNIELRVIGRTNYKAAAGWNAKGYGGVFTQKVSMSLANTNLFKTLTTNVWDLGMVSWKTNAYYLVLTNPVTHVITTNAIAADRFFDGLVITNCPVVTNLDGITHLADTIYCWLYIGKPNDPTSCRFYSLPCNSNNWIEISQCYTYPALQPFIKRELLNERTAILQMLQVTDWTWFAKWWGYYAVAGEWLAIDSNNKGESIGSLGPDYTWANAKIRALAGWYMPYTDNASPYAFTCGQNDTDQYVCFAERRAAYYRMYLSWGSISFYTNIDCRIDFYNFATNRVGSVSGWPPDGGVVEFDDNGDEVYNCRWYEWDSQNITKGRTTPITSEKLGDISGGCPAMPNGTPATDTSLNHGYIIGDQHLLTYWGFRYCKPP